MSARFSQPPSDRRLYPGTIALGSAIFFAACLHVAVAVEKVEQVLYYDRNGDGRIDMERHRCPSAAGSDWELVDENRDGRYEKKILHGFAIVEAPVDLPVPAQVRAGETEQ